VKETRLEQVKRTGVLRCGYINWPPMLMKDNNSGKLSGPFYDLLEEMGRQLKLKVEWTAEVSWGEMLADLALGRYDAVCIPVMETPARAREADFTVPIFYAPFNLYVRKDDMRFDNNFDLANQPDIKFSGLDGGYSSTAADELFSKATKLYLPQLSGSADLYMMVASKKVDAVISDPYTFSRFDAANPGALRAAAGKPLLVLSLGLSIPSNEPAFKSMLNTTIDYLHNSGFVDKVLKKYEGAEASLRVAKPYEEGD